MLCMHALRPVQSARRGQPLARARAGARLAEHQLRAEALRRRQDAAEERLQLQLGALRHDHDHAAALGLVRMAQLRDYLLHDLQVALAVAPAQEQHLRARGRRPRSGSPGAQRPPAPRSAALGCAQHHTSWCRVLHSRPDACCGLGQLAGWALMPVAQTVGSEPRPEPRHSRDARGGGRTWPFSNTRLPRFTLSSSTCGPRSVGQGSPVPPCTAVAADCCGMLHAHLMSNLSGPILRLTTRHTKADTQGASLHARPAALEERAPRPRAPAARPAR